MRMGDELQSHLASLLLDLITEYIYIYIIYYYQMMTGGLGLGISDAAAPA